MSRLESNAEPSMEEILASIRKIIAEDSSGLRAPSTPPRPGTPYSPAQRTSTPQPSSPMPQRGFMSREAFMKSSQPAEPEPRETFAPRSTGSDNRSASASRLRPIEEAPRRETSYPSLREREAALAREPLRAREELNPKEPAATKEPTLPASAKDQAESPKSETHSPSRNGAASIEGIKTLEPATIETVEVVPVEDALPIVKEDAPAVLKVESKSVTATDTTSIEAQLTELLSEDLNALRQGRAKALAEETIIDVEDPKVKSNETSKSDGSVGAASENESGDPFAFDLGPSPFAAKSEVPRPAPAATLASISPVEEAAPAEKSGSPTPAASAEPESAPAAPRSTAPELAPEPSPPPAARASSFEAGAAEKSSRVNGTPYYYGPSAAGHATPPASVPPSPNAASTSPVSEPDAQKSRKSFVVPSVSATLGPYRKLEPLSNAFHPVPPPPSALESFAPQAESEPTRAYRPEPAQAHEPPRAAERPVPVPPPAPSTASNRHEETASHSTLPTTTSESNLDRPMEDAVADLLRPLLKTWLAENMPKIVERALRREMSERLLPGQKNPHD